MLGHLTEEALLDAAEGHAGPAAREHVRDCASCAARVDEAREGLALLETEEAPEPPAWYYETLRREVAARLDAKPRRSFAGWLLPAAAAAALLVIVPFASRTPLSQPVPTASPSLPAWSALPPAEEDAELAVLEVMALAEPEAAVAALDRPPSVDEELLDLSDEDGQALVRAIDARRGGQL